MIRYFRSADAVYEGVRRALDEAWGYPNEGTRTQTAFPPAAAARRDQQGRVYLAVPAAYCDYVAVAEVLPALLASGSIEEITAAQYRGIFPPPARPPRVRT